MLRLLQSLTAKEISTLLKYFILYDFYMTGSKLYEYSLLSSFQSELDYTIIPFFFVIKPTLCYVLVSSALVICLAGSMVGISEAFYLTVFQGRNVCCVRSTGNRDICGLNHKAPSLPKSLLSCLQHLTQGWVPSQ